MDLNAAVDTIMAKDVETVSPDQTLIDVKHIYEKQNFHHHIPVVEGGKIVGMVSLVDFMYKIGNATLSDADQVYHELKVMDIMTRNPKTASSSSTIHDVASTLAEGQFHAMIIADNGILSGIVTTTDILNYILKENQ